MTQTFVFTRNLLLDYGTEAEVWSIAVEAIEIKANATSAGQSVVSLEVPLYRPLSVGDRVQFGSWNTMVVADTVPAGANSITFTNALTRPLSAIEANQSGYKIINLTGYTIESEVRADWDSATALATFTPSIEDQINGIYKLSMSVAMAPNVDEKDLIQLKNNSFFTRPRRTKKKAADGTALPDDYVWDVKLINPVGIRKKHQEGIVLVSGSATQ